MYIDYNCRIPLIGLTNARGVSTNYLMHLEKQLNELASKIIGEVMVFELVQHIQVPKMKLFKNITLFE